MSVMGKFWLGIELGTLFMMGMFDRYIMDIMEADLVTSLLWPCLKFWVPAPKKWWAIGGFLPIWGVNDVTSPYKKTLWLWWLWKFSPNGFASSLDNFRSFTHTIGWGQQPTSACESCCDVRLLLIGVRDIIEGKPPFPQPFWRNDGVNGIANGPQLIFIMVKQTLCFFFTSPLLVTSLDLIVACCSYINQFRFGSSCILVVAWRLMFSLVGLSLVDWLLPQSTRHIHYNTASEENPEIRPICQWTVSLEREIRWY